MKGIFDNVFSGEICVCLCDMKFITQGMIYHAGNIGFYTFFDAINQQVHPCAKQR